MGFKLIGNRKQIPAGIPFKDPRTGRVFDAYERGLNETVKMIIEHRSSNPHFYPEAELKWFDLISVRQEILAEVYKKRPDLFEKDSVDKPYVYVPVENPNGKACQCGSTEFEEVYCPTCSGKRLTGWKCKTCGKVKKK